MLTIFNPVLGVQLLGEIQSDVYLRMERCWATPIAEATSERQFELLNNGCEDELAAAQGMQITRNGVAVSFC